MQNDTVEIVGVYQLEKEDIKDYDGLLNPENVENAVAIEMLIKKPPQKIDGNFLAEITQANDSLPRDSWQAVYDERFLNESGTEIVSENEVRNMNSVITRIVFFSIISILTNRCKLLSAKFP